MGNDEVNKAQHRDTATKMGVILTPAGQGQGCYIYSGRLPGLGWTGPRWAELGERTGHGRIQTEEGREHR